MDAFETIAARFFEVQGYWTRVGVKVDITKAEKVGVKNPSMPRPELDVICWKPAKNELLIVECKSYLDSTGVRAEHFHGEEVKDDAYKLLNRTALRELVVSALIRQLRGEGLLIGDDRWFASSWSQERSIRTTSSPFETSLSETVGFS